MQMTKKVVSVVLAVMMVVSMMAVMGMASAYAYDSIADVDAAIRAGGTVTLDNNYTYSGTLYVPVGKTVVLDLAGFELKTANDAIRNDGTLTINDSVGGGKITSTGDSCVVAVGSARTTINAGTFTSQEGTVVAFGPKATTYIKGGTFTAKDNAVFMGNGTYNDTTKYNGNTWYIQGGTFNAYIESAGYTACGIYAPNADTWNVSGGTFNVTNGVGIVQRAGTVKVTGGTFNVTGDGTTGKVGDSRVVVPSGTAIVYDSKAVYPAQTDTAKTTVTGGTFNTETASVAQVKNDGDATRVTATGGTFDKEVAAEFIDPIYEYDDATDKIVAKQGLTPVWEWVEQAAGSSYRYKLKLTLKDGETEVYSKEYYPSIVVDGNDFKYVYSTSSNAVKVAGVSYNAPTKYANANGVIMTSYELSKAALAGGSWKLGQDITGVGAMKIADGFKLDGQNYMIKSGTVSTMNRCMFEANTATTKYEFKNVTLDGNKLMKRALAAHTTSGGNNAGNVIDLDTVTIQNFKSNDYVGAINAFGSSTWNLTDCTIVGNTVKATTPDEQANTGAAVWAGAKATVNINGGTYDEILLHGGTANTTIDGGATVDTVRFGFTNDTEDSTKMQAVVKNATVGEVVSYTDFVEENVVIDPNQATVAAPAGYDWDNSVQNGMKTLVPENPLNKAMDKVDDGNQFGLTCGYKKGAILGVQIKDKTLNGMDASVTSESGQEVDGHDIRFVAVLDTAIINDPEIEDFGFVLTKVDKTLYGTQTARKYGNTNFDALKVDAGNGEKTISAKGTWNNICSAELAYGNTKDTTTTYKYITCAVNGVSEDEYVVARLYVKKGGKTYYGKYAGYNYHYNGCMSGYNAAEIG